MRFAFFSLLFVSSSSWATAPSPEIGAAEGEQRRAERAGKVANDEVVEANRSLKPTDPGGYQTACGDGEDKLESDLCAQWVGAKSARKSAIWTQVQGGIGIIGVFGLLANL